MTPPDSTPPDAPGPAEPSEPTPSESTESAAPAEPASSDHRGVGQSGYAAGRRDPDRSLGRHLQPRNANYPPKTDDEPRHDDLHTDDRFTGRGGSERPPPGSDRS